MATKRRRCGWTLVWAPLAALTVAWLFVVAHHVQHAPGQEPPLVAGPAACACGLCVAPRLRLATTLRVHIFTTGRERVSVAVAARARHSRRAAQPAVAPVPPVPHAVSRPSGVLGATASFGSARGLGERSGRSRHGLDSALHAFAEIRISVSG